MIGNVSIKFGFCGAGQGGGRFAAEASNRYGYPSIVINCARSDLDGLELSPKRKLFLDYGLDGAGKNLVFGREAFEQNRERIKDFIRIHLSDDVEYITICVGGGGGTGSGGVSVLIEIFQELGLPVGMIITLPLESEDTTTKQNCLTTLKRLLSTDGVRPLIIVDNEKIHTKYPHLSVNQIWPTANREVIQTFHLFNMFSAKKSEHHSFDMADYQMMLRTPGCMAMGRADITEYRGKEELAESAKHAITSGLFAEGFDLATAQKAGIIIRGTKKVFDRIKAIDLDYMYNYIRDQIQAGTIYRGVYQIDGLGDHIEIYSIFAGLDLPKERLKTLSAETQQEQEIVAQKKSRASIVDDVFGTESEYNETREDDEFLEFIKKKTSKKKDGFWK